VIGAPSILRLTRKAAALARVLPTLLLSCARNAEELKVSLFPSFLIFFFHSFFIPSFLGVVEAKTVLRKRSVNEPARTENGRKPVQVAKYKLFNKLTLIRLFLFFFFPQKHVLGGGSGQDAGSRAGGVLDSRRCYIVRHPGLSPVLLLICALSQVWRKVR
jgi:hypothetical protein